MNRNRRVFRITIGTLTAMSLLSNISSISLANYNYELEQELISNTYDFGPPPYDKVTSDAYDFSPPPYDEVTSDAYDFSPPSYDEKIDDNTNFNSSTYYDDNQDYTNSYGSWDDTTDNTNNYKSFSDSVCESPKIYSPTNDFKQALGTDVVLKWEQNGETPDYYMLYFWGVGDGSSIEIPGNSLTYTIDSNYFNTEGTYVLGLYAVNDAGQSDVSSINISLYSFGEVIISNNNNDYAPLNTDYTLNWRHAGKIVANQYVVQVVRDGKDVYNESISSTSKPYIIPGYVFNEEGTYVIGIYAKYGSLQNQTAINVIVDEKIDANINVIVDEKIDANRKKVVDYMREMAKVEWKPSSDIPYHSGNRIFNPQKTYKGIPYTQTARGTNLNTFKQNLENGIYYGPSTPYLGNDCSSAVSIAWQQANPNFKLCYTGSMYPTESYISEVGTYTFKDEEDNKIGNTKYICNFNGRKVMKEAYESLKPGDAVMYDLGGGKGHAQLVVSNDLTRKTITTIEQTGLNKVDVELTGDPDTDKELKYIGEVDSTWNIDKSITYDELFESGYIPITMTYWK